MNHNLRNVPGYITFDEALVKYNKLKTDYNFSNKTLAVLVNCRFAKAPIDHHKEKYINEDDLKRIIYFLNQQMENNKIKIQ